MRYEAAKVEIVRFSENSFTRCSGPACGTYTKGNICYGFSWDGGSCGTFSMNTCYTYQDTNDNSCSTYGNNSYLCYGYNGNAIDNPISVPELKYSCAGF